MNEIAPRVAPGIISNSHGSTHLAIRSDETEVKMNAKWHEENPMPNKATDKQRMAWHLKHHKNCACRPIPSKLAAVMNPRASKTTMRPG